MVRGLGRLIRSVLGLAALPVLALLAVQQRRPTRARQRANAKPRLVYGPVPILSIKYMCEAMRERGYEATTVVYEVYPINDRRDFDYHIDDIVASSGIPSWLVPVVSRVAGPYFAFAWSLPRFDVYHFFFDGGFLFRTWLRALEVHLLHLAGKKVVCVPYGSDAAIPTHIQSMEWRQGLMASYPRLGRDEQSTHRRVLHLCRVADFIVGCLIHAETLPRWDLLTTHYYPINERVWSRSETRSSGNGRDGLPVRIAHTPNHRGVKGTEFLIAACRQLEQEGYSIELVLMEGLSNTTVADTLANCDVLAEQFILGYALSAMEGMCMGLPVISNLSNDHYYRVHRLYTGLNECPIVSTPIEALRENLLKLVTNPELRAQLGAAGRSYAHTFHSYEATSAMWEMIYDSVWHGWPLPYKYWNPRTMHSNTELTEKQIAS